MCLISSSLTFAPTDEDLDIHDFSQLSTAQIPRDLTILQRYILDHCSRDRSLILRASANDTFLDNIFPPELGEVMECDLADQTSFLWRKENSSSVNDVEDEPTSLTASWISESQHNLGAGKDESEHRKTNRKAASDGPEEPQARKRKEPASESASRAILSTSSSSSPSSSSSSSSHHDDPDRGGGRVGIPKPVPIGKLRFLASPVWQSLITDVRVRIRRCSAARMDDAVERLLQVVDRKEMGSGSAGSMLVSKKRGNITSKADNGHFMMPMGT